DHTLKILPLIHSVLKQSKTSPADLNGIAYTAGPGLIGALLTGVSMGRSLAWTWNIPSVAINHMEGHLLAPMLQANNQPEFPFVCLLVSGGHTLLVDVKNIGNYTILGESVDDAAGEAFDKTAKLLGLPYPGGPELAKLANSVNHSRFTFPRPMINRPGLDFSFSGLKTFALNTIKQNENHQDKSIPAEIAFAFQEAVVDTLSKKCLRALKQTQYKSLVISGGVSANQNLRQHLKNQAKINNIQLFYPDHEFCTDNGAMIALAGYYRLQNQQFEPLSFNAKPKWSLEKQFNES
ncbi:MAG: tRNA (adenosine(37)-N6)-threonylcarbamoyltransferase complex transferase subunit TsaD, partial [Methylococcales bacterium]|nr:tRNA (adenosine(37)-N6)-threonylcarbamoyltransferase complex transferase subunit TsaD [Methylococcales bacterium]